MPDEFDAGVDRHADGDPLYMLSASEAAAGLRRRRFSVEALVRSCLRRIAELEPATRAWAHLERDAAMRRARRLDAAPAPVGPLHGLPVGVKDIIDAADMPTGCNSPIYLGHRPARDAWVVARLRAAGAIILGKTHTSEFAYLSPAPTRNPLDRRHTPGGSSSGSAAAVGGGMVPLAIGTQTGGSTIRPAAYCGAFAMKPSYSRFPVNGVKPLAPSFDTLGFFGRSVADLALVDAALGGSGSRARRALGRAPRIRIGFCRTPFWRLADTSTRRLLRASAAMLETAGFDVEPVELPDEVLELNAGFYRLVAAEAVWSLAKEYREHRELLSSRASRLVETGLRLDAESLRGVRVAQRRCALAMERLFGRVDALLTPAAPGEAERGRTLGNNEFNRIWTALFLPCLCLPAGRGPGGLPIGIQLVGRFDDDRRLLHVGARVAEVLALPPVAGRQSG